MGLLLLGSWCPKQKIGEGKHKKSREDVLMVEQRYTLHCESRPVKRLTVALRIRRKRVLQYLGFPGWLFLHANETVDTCLIKNSLSIVSVICCFIEKLTWFPDRH